MRPARPIPGCPALPPVIGHRGAAASAPENTLAGFRQAKALGCRWIEFDIRLTVDGVPLVCHDDRLERTTGRPGRISELPAARVREIDAGAPFDVLFRGERIPTLAEVLTLACELDLGCNIEIKAEPGLEAATAEAVAGCLAASDTLPAVLVSSFLPDALAAIRELAPLVPRGLLLAQVGPDWRDTAEALDCATIHVNQKRLRPELVDAIGLAGYPVLAYTVNDPARARQLFDWGVASVFSDIPERILSMLARASLRQGSTTADVAMTIYPGAA